MADAARWEPDAHLVPAARAGRLTMSELSAPDRAWVVAHLTAEGMTAAEIADRMGCSLRLVKTVRADPATAVVAMLIAETATFEDETTLLRSELRATTRDVAGLTSLVADLRAQIARLTGQARCRAGHTLNGWNSYERPDGRVECRQCIADRSRRYRQRQKPSCVPA
ncbi:HNH endonuclease [Gordonia phage Mariokart]|nr:HNH endonuclease [Gordonia phage Mariokart]